MTQTRMISVVLLTAALAACGSSADPADPQTARERAASSVAILDEAAQAIQFTTESDTLGATEGSLGHMNGAVEAPIVFPEDLHFVTPPAADEAPWSEELRDFLEEVVFTDANYEGDGVYRLRGADFCPVDELTGAPDPECVADFDAAELRVRAVLAGDGLDLTLLVGPDRVEPLTVELRSDRIAVIVDLRAARAAVVHIAGVLGEPIDLPRIMEGVVSVELALNGPADVTLSAAIREAVRVEGDLPDAGGSYAFSSEARDPLFRARAEGPASRLSIDLDVGETTFSIPWESFSFDEDTASMITGLLAIDAKGLSASAVLEEGASALQLTNVGLGSGKSTVHLGDTEILSWLLNGDSGNKFDLAITPDAESASFAFSPEFDLSIGVDLSPFAAAGETVEPELIGEVYRIEIDGADPATVRPVASDPVTLEGGGLSVVSGRLRLSASSGAEVVVPAGQCLVDDVVTSGEHPLIGAFAAASCL